MNNFKMSPQLLNIFNSKNPQQFAMNLLQKNAKGNPMLENILGMANKGDMNGVEQVCKNILRSKGYDPDELMKNFQNQMK